MVKEASASADASFYLLLSISPGALIHSKCFKIAENYPGLFMEARKKL
jgi:hypothetical protein